MKWRTRQSGFTLVELTVTMGIFLLMVSVVLARYRSFGVSAEFDNAVEDVVLSLREAQVYGAGGKKSTVTCGGSAFNCAYGVRLFSAGTSYAIFADANGNNVWDTGETIQTMTLPSGVTAALSASPLDIVFKRPFPDAIINTSLDSASITLTKSGGYNATVNITSAGQISIQ